MDVVKKAVLLKALRDSLNQQIEVVKMGKVPAKFKFVKKLYSPSDGLNISFAMGPNTTYSAQELQELVDNEEIYAYQTTLQSGIYIGLKDLSMPFDIMNNGRPNNRGIIPIEIKEGWSVDASGVIYNIGDRESKTTVTNFINLKTKCTNIFSTMQVNSTDTELLQRSFSDIDMIVNVMAQKLSSLQALMPTVGPKYEGIVQERLDQLTVLLNDCVDIRTQAQALLP